MAIFTSLCYRIVHNRLRYYYFRNSQILVRFASTSETETTDKPQQQKEADDISSTRIENPRVEEEDNDFFGFNEDDSSFMNERFEAADDVRSKYDELRKEDKEKFYITNFGKIRLDSENPPNRARIWNFSTPSQNDDFHEIPQKSSQRKGNRNLSFNEIPSYHLSNVQNEVGDIEGNLKDDLPIDDMQASEKTNPLGRIEQKRTTNKQRHISKIEATSEFATKDSKRDFPTPSQSENFEDFSQLPQKPARVRRERKMRSNENASISEQASSTSKPEGGEIVTTNGATIKDSYIDEVYFPESVSSDQPLVVTEIEETKSKKLDDCKSPPSAVRSSYIDEIYFPSYGADEADNKNNFSPETSDPPQSFIEEQYFQTVKFQKESIDHSLPVQDYSVQETNYKQSLEEPDGTKVFKRSSSDMPSKKKVKRNEEVIADKDKQNSWDSEDLGSIEDPEGISMKDRISQNQHQTKEGFERAEKGFKTALDYVQTLRQQKLKDAAARKESTVILPDGTIKKMDPTERTYTGKPDRMIIDFHKKTEDEIFQILKESIIYNSYGIVALNKPHGLTSQLSHAHNHHIQKFIPLLAKYVDREASTPDLYPVHRLDVGTTGVFLMAKNEKTHYLLKQLFKQRKIQKTYWAITKGIPSPPEGIINIPMAEGKIEERVRMVLRPEIDDELKLLAKKRSGECYEAITQYRVLNTSGSAALVEMNPKTGITHQLRVHLGFGLNCPILGDHKYSYLTRLAPQRLPDDMLQKLGVRQTKVRDLPIHLHARSVVIPEIADGRNIFIQAPLPKHFKWAMKKLKLTR